ncbi:Tex family protein [Chloroflexota bacterium]
MSHINQIAAQLKIKHGQVTATIELLDADNTIPFIARYRKEATGSLDEEQIRAITSLLSKLRAMDERRETILKSIQGQEKLTPELKAQILAATTRTQLEDLYQPYKQKRKTRASVARERGLQPLADLILKQATVTQPLSKLAGPYLNKEISKADQAWSGARDIVAETISDHPEVRRITRDKAAKWGSQQVKKINKAEDPRGIFQDYYNFNLRLDRMRPHQILAINRGESEKILRVKIDIPDRDWRFAVNNQFRKDRSSPLAEQLELAAERLLLPAIERDLRRALTERAETHAIQIFAKNLQSLLNQPPLIGHTILGIDPGFRTGCKVTVVDPTGKVLNTDTIFPHPPQKLTGKAKQILTALIEKYFVTLIAIGNGTASRETEQLIAELLSNLQSASLHYLIVSEAGASVYSASKLARSELPNMDVSMRGAVSIARRVQDPLAEFVKMEPKSIGIGMYQHDVDQKELAQSLDAVVESVVNHVGVDINTASPALLTRVAGIGPKLATRITEYRDLHGRFKDRSGLRNVPGLGPKAFEQSAGFLRIRNGHNPLDSSAIHPESYLIAEQVLQRAGLGLDSTPDGREPALNSLRERIPLEDLAIEFRTGLPTLEDIFEQLIRPGRDPRANLPAPLLRSDVLKIEDLTTGMQLKGTVRNVVDFGAFIDLGVKQDGLLHRSQIPRDAQLGVGDIIKVNVLKVEINRHRISLGWVNTK